MLKINNSKSMNLEIKILGTGCKKCETLKQLTEEVIGENNINATIEKVEDIEKIMEYEVMNTPALVVNNKVVIAGRIPSKIEISESILSEKSIENSAGSTCSCGGNC